MPIIADVAKWAGQQPLWVSDAIRRLFLQGELANGDIDDLAAMAKASFGIPDPENRAAAPLDPASVPQKPLDAPPVSIVGIRDPKFINAIPTTNGITFATAGLTTVYGHNGAGKSGYARTLKKACRARMAEDIHPNVFDAADNPGPAQATFEWVEGIAKVSATWTNGNPSPEALSRIAVFDSHCARVFVDDQAAVSYIPYGLDILRDLASGLQLIQRQVDQEALGKKYDISRLDPLRGDTEVGKLIAGLKHTTQAAPFEKLAKLTGEESEEKATLTKLLGDEDPSKAASNLRRFATRLQVLGNDLECLEGPLSDENVDALEDAFQKLVAAEQAAKLASSVIQENGKALPGTGSEPWEILLKSAMKFATEVAYPGTPFPGPAVDAKCVVCQQYLVPEAKARLERFATFLESDAQRQVTQHREQGKVLYKAMKAVDFNAFPADAVFMEDLKDHHSELHCAIEEFVVELTERKKTILAMAPMKTLKGLASLSDSPSFALHALRHQKLSQAEKLEAQMTPEIRAAKTKRLAELNAREKLGGLLLTVVEAIAALKVEHSYSEASRACATTAVTRKMNELYEETVTAELKAALFKECQALNVRSEILGLDMSGQRGARMQKLKLASAPKFARIKPSAILSEGEQRAVALATFLAEVSIQGDGSGVVFDDPVSSLDQVRKDRIAKRFVLEAKHRQVIVFTHDLSFAWALRDHAESNAVLHEERFVFQSQGSTGYVQPDFPFEAKKLDARVNSFKDQSKAARKALEVDKNFEVYNDKARQLYRRMRDTWELVVEDLLFNGSVKRFRRSIQTLPLASVEVDDADIQEVYSGMTRCSSFTHEGGAEDPPPLPDPDGLDADLAALTDAISRLKGRLDGVKKRRKDNGMLA